MHERPHAIFVSPLRRTHETAAPLEAVCGLEPAVLGDLARCSSASSRASTAVPGGGDPIIQQVFAEQRWDAIPRR